MSRPATPPSGLRRVAAAYGAALAGVVPATLTLLVGLHSAESAEGLSGLDDLLVAAVLAGVMLVVGVLWGNRRLGLGWFHLVALLLALGLMAYVVAAVNAADVWLVAVAPLPAVAAIVSDEGLGSARRVRRAGAVLLASTVAVAAAAVLSDRSHTRAEEAAVAGPIVPPVGLRDDRAWHYVRVGASPLMFDQALGHTVIHAAPDYDIVDGRGRRLTVTALEPGATVTGIGVALGGEPPRVGRRVTVAGLTAEIAALPGVFSDSELDTLAAQLEPKSARWLVERE